MLSAQVLQQWEAMDPETGLRYITETVRSGIVFSTSLGQEDQVITDMIYRAALPVQIFTLDTGRLFYEHYTLLQRNSIRYGKQIKVYYPRAEAVESYVNEKGIDAFYESVDNRKSCCHIRKVEPLNRALQGAGIWITGLRAEQSENRQDMQKITWDATRQLYKYNPLLHWSYEQVLQYLTDHQVPDLPLHRQGYISIGCQPCTRPVAPGESPRSGRWWWETSQKECGLHNR